VVSWPYARAQQSKSLLSKSPSRPCQKNAPLREGRTRLQGDFL